MSGKKGRAFFICPRWSELEAPAKPAPGLDGRTLAALKEGRPMARSTLRKALLAVRQTSGSMFDVDAFLVDRRAAGPR